MGHMTGLQLFLPVTAEILFSPIQIQVPKTWFLPL